MNAFFFIRRNHRKNRTTAPVRFVACPISVLFLWIALALFLSGCKSPAHTVDASVDGSGPAEEENGAKATADSDLAAGSAENVGSGDLRNSSSSSAQAVPTDDDSDKSSTTNDSSVKSNTTDDSSVKNNSTSDSSVKNNSTDDSPLPASSLPAPSTSGALHVSGTQLVDSKEQPVQLRGISTHGLAWFPDYVNEECFAQLRHEWNVNVIRLAMYTAESGGYCTDGDPARLKELIRDGIRFAASQDLYVIVDWHVLSEQNPNQYLEEAKTFFGEISQEFAQETHILYEICNEPNGQTSWSEIQAYARNVIPIIRANDPDAVILIGTPNWSQMVDQAAEDPLTEYDNLMYTLHFYAATHQDDLRAKMESALSLGLPIFVSEYGICDASGNGGLDFEQADAWIASLDQHNISYVAWNLSNKNESSALLRDSCTKTSGFTSEDLSASGQWLHEMLQKVHAKTAADRFTRRRIS